MKRNSGKYSALMLLTLTTALVSGVARADCRLDDGASKENPAYASADVLPPCSEQTEAVLGTTASKANETSQEPSAQKITIVPSQDGLRDKPPVKQ